MSDDETELASSESRTEHARAWSLGNSAEDTIPYGVSPQRTTLWLRVCAALTAASVAALVGVLLFVLHGRNASPEQDTRNQTTVAQAAPPPRAAAPTETVTKTVSPPAPVEVAPASAQTTFVICDDGREGVVGGHTTCLFAENVRRAFYASSDGSDVVAFSPVTGERYEMVCSGGYRANFVDGSHRVATRCVGGDSATAEVVIW
jgi:hypothetical protein